jgi:hypothetical protein
LKFQVPLKKGGGGVENYKIKETHIDIEAFPSLTRLQTNPFLVPSFKQMFPFIFNQ